MAAPVEAEAYLTTNEKKFFGVSLGLMVIGLLFFPDLIGISGVGAALAAITQAARHNRRNTKDSQEIDPLF